MDCFSIAYVKSIEKDGNLLFTEYFLLSVMIIESKHTLYLPDIER